MSEFKSLKDLNPNKQTEEDQSATVDTTVNEDYETPATEFDSVSDVVVSEEVEAVVETEATEIHHEDMDYIHPDEDTSLGTNGAFDFASSINRRRQLVTEKVEAIQEAELEKEIAEYSDESEDTSSSFKDDEEFDMDMEDDEITQNTSYVPPVKSAAPVKQNELAKAAVSKEPIKTESTKLPTADEMPTMSDMFFDESDFDDIDDDENKSDDILQEKEIEDLRSKIAKKLRVVEENFDIKGFTIAKVPISVNTALQADESSVKAFDWPLMSAGRLLSMTALSGAEIDSLAGGTSRNRFNNLKDAYRILYNHIVDPTKPEFEPWLKVTSFMDVPHIYMAAYKSSFDASNHIPYTCTNSKCNHVFLSEDVPIKENMVKFRDDAAKLKFDDIMENGSTSSACLYETRIIPVSPRYAIAFREPSIYNTIFENAILDAKFVEKYQKLLSLMVYIDNIYYINNGTLVPIALKVDHDNLAKTTKYKITTYAKIIQKLSSDSFQRITSIISEINDASDEIMYQLPEVTCPKCETVIPSEIKESTELLFNRHQLALIANS